MPVQPPHARGTAADLLDEPRLADAGVAGREEERSPAFGESLHQVRGGRQLPLAANQRADTGSGGGLLRMVGALSEQPPRPHRAFLALERELIQWRQVEPASRELVSELPDIGLARRGHGLESLGQVHRVPEDRVVADLPAERPGDDPPASSSPRRPATRTRKRQAVALLRRRLDAGDTAAPVRNPLLERSPATTLAEILLYEGEADDAWAAAVAHGCDERTWMTLARARESTHPLDAVPIHERAVAAQIDTKKNGGYRAAVDLLARIRTLTAKAGEPQRFANLLASITAEHGRKRNLMALIDKKRWT